MPAVCFCHTLHYLEMHQCTNWVSFKVINFVSFSIFQVCVISWFEVMNYGSFWGRQFVTVLLIISQGWIYFKTWVFSEGVTCNLKMLCFQGASLLNLQKKKERTNFVTTVYYSINSCLVHVAYSMHLGVLRMLKATKNVRISLTLWLSSGATTSIMLQWWHLVQSLTRSISVENAASAENMDSNCTEPWLKSGLHSIIYKPVTKLRVNKSAE